MPALLLLTGPSAGLRYEIASEATLGRSPSCELPLDDGKVSRRHARIVVQDGQARIRDLGSRNGTRVNGERIESETVLLPGDQVQVGETTMLFEPPTAASLARSGPAGASPVPIEEVLPHVGPEAALCSAGVALLGASSEAMVLRRTAEEALHALRADAAAALLGGGVEGLLTAAVVGAASVAIPREMAQVALERSELGCSATVLCAPLVASGGQPFGVLYVARPEPAFTAADGRLVAMLGRLGGEAYAAVRSRVDAAPPCVELVGTSRPFQRVLEQVHRAAASSVPVVLHGEPGTGKSLAARYIHARSPRALGPLVTVDCRESAGRVEEALLGRTSGPGLPPLSSALLRADGGTLLLQHVEALPRALAERLARWIAQRVAPARQGGEEPVEVRFVATASAPLWGLAASGEVEGSLARALTGIELELPPLRERRADVLALFTLFTHRVARDLRRGPPTLTPEARSLLTEYGWPQNVRELKLLGERLALLHADAQVPVRALPPELLEGSVSPAPPSLHQRLSRLERDAITEALRDTGGKKILAAKLLGISRPTLDRKLEEYGISLERRRGR